MQLVITTKWSKTMRAVIYIRVSTNQQAKDGVSLKAQENKLIKYCEFQGLEVVKILRDEGFSGSNGNREGYIKLMEMIYNKEIDAVCVYSLSRFGRNTVEVLNSVEKMNKNNIQFHSLTEKIDTTTPMGRFFLTTLAGLGQLEREQLAERTKSALQHKKENNERIGQIPYGYDLDKDGIHLIENDREQRVIKLVVKLRNKGLSFQKIANELSKRECRNKAGRIKWNHSQTSRIFKSVA